MLRRMRRDPNQIDDTRGDKVFSLVNGILIAIAFVIFAFPIYYIIISSISDPTAVANGQVTFFPVGFNLNGYRSILTYKDIWIGYGNSILYTFVGTVISVVMLILYAYPISRRDFKAAKVMTVLLVVTMLFQGGVIPSYLLIKDMHMLDSMWAIILPKCLIPTYVIMCRTYFQTSIPNELQEAAMLDGCGHFRYLISIVLPLSLPVIAVMVLYSAVNYWNSYFDALLYLSTRAKYPLQIILREILILNESIMSEGGTISEDLKNMVYVVKYGIIIVSSLPLLILYPFVQKHFVKGVMIGAVKG